MRPNENAHSDCNDVVYVTNHNIIIYTILKDSRIYLFKFTRVRYLRCNPKLVKNILNFEHSIIES